MTGQDIVFEHVTPPPKWRPPLGDPEGPGAFFCQQVTLPAGRLGARVQVMPPGGASHPGEQVVAEIWPIGGGAAPLARRASDVDARFLTHGADWLLLDLTLPAATEVEIRVSASARAGRYRLRAVKVQRAGARRAAALDWTTTHAVHDRWPLESLRSVIIGNSGICTASCVHCPTNKPWLAVPAGAPMPAHIFDRLLDGLVRCGLRIEGSVGFGLFADPMTDRHLSERVRRVKTALPDTPITLSTTGAAFAPRHAEAVALADSIGVHIESIDPALYDRLMAPLRLARVRPRIEALVRLAGPKARLAVPVHRDIRAGLPALVDWWTSIGGGPPLFQPFTNRLSEDRAVLDLHFAPVTGACTQDLARELIIDWDGRIVTCCNDFGRRGSLCTLAEHDLPTLLGNRHRQRLFDRLRRRDWQSLDICRSCLFDDPAATQLAVAPPSGA